ncbi:hypothetical protein E0494_02315 [Marinilabiliaceae bacterium JC040]|nr:hypothetical protein [Marinilabiliaceae bacterium JC040]
MRQILSTILIISLLSFSLSVKADIKDYNKVSQNVTTNSVHKYEFPATVGNKVEWKVFIGSDETTPATLNTHYKVYSDEALTNEITDLSTPTVDRKLIYIKWLDVTGAFVVKAKEYTTTDCSDDSYNSNYVIVTVEANTFDLNLSYVGINGVNRPTDVGDIDNINECSVANEGETVDNLKYLNVVKFKVTKSGGVFKDAPGRGSWKFTFRYKTGVNAWKTATISADPEFDIVAVNEDETSPVPPVGDDTSLGTTAGIKVSISKDQDDVYIIFKRIIKPEGIDSASGDYLIALELLDAVDGYNAPFKKLLKTSLTLNIHRLPSKKTISLD